MSVIDFIKEHKKVIFVIVLITLLLLFVYFMQERKCIKTISDRMIDSITNSQFEEMPQFVF